MDTAPVLLMCLEQGTRPLEEHLMDYLFPAPLTTFPDDILCSFLIAGLEPQEHSYPGGVLGGASRNLWSGSAPLTTQCTTKTTQTARIGSLSLPQATSLSPPVLPLPPPLFETVLFHVDICTTLQDPLQSPTSSATLSSLSPISPSVPPLPPLSGAVTPLDCWESSPPGLLEPVAPPPTSACSTPLQPDVLTPTTALLPPSVSAVTIGPSASLDSLGMSAALRPSTPSAAACSSLPQAPPPSSVAPAQPQPSGSLLPPRGGCHCGSVVVVEDVEVISVLSQHRLCGYAVGSTSHVDIASCHRHDVIQLSSTMAPPSSDAAVEHRPGCALGYHQPVPSQGHPSDYTSCTTLDSYVLPPLGCPSSS
ncbi:hypothetical protein DPX16_8681 [Anabarilius grahami]|uniref:Uncharacterized protein n=1 Tax=Anabarilius grahami TaxID=495550 RepID=A0A3N0YDF2_ANAGA|nr:hypothetical protein DPX16_8681 [Anabarilius grahami]